MKYDVYVHRHLLTLIMSGEKDLEVRVAIPHFKRIRENDILVFSPNCIRWVKAIRKYDSFALMLQAESAKRIGPGYAESVILSELRRIYPADKERLGVIVFELVKEK